MLFRLDSCCPGDGKDPSLGIVGLLFQGFHNNVKTLVCSPVHRVPKVLPGSLVLAAVFQQDDPQRNSLASTDLLSKRVQEAVHEAGVGRRYGSRHQGQRVLRDVGF